MCSLPTAIQRLQVPLQSAVDPLYAYGRAWHRRGFSLPPEKHEQLLSGSLGELINHFRRCGLCEDPAYGQSSGAGYAGLAQMPVMTRESLRALFPRLQQISQRRRDITAHVSGGSTGDPIQFLQSRRQRRLAGGCNLGMYLMLGWRPGMPRFSLWGREPAVQPGPMGRPRLRSRLRQWLQHTSAFGGYLPAESEYLAFLDAVRSHPGCAVFGFTSLLESCAILMKERGLELPAGFLATAWACSEMLSSRQRRLIEDAFGVGLRRHYGSRECSATAADCTEGTLHINPRYIIEAVDPQTFSPLPAGHSGSLLITDLFNDATPFIRYEVGDLGAVAWRECACGRRGPCLVQFNGRTAGLFTLPSGTRASALCFAGIYNHFPALHQCQAVRLGPAEFELRYTGSQLEDAICTRLARMTSDLLEGAQVRVVRAAELERSPTGKLVAFLDLSGQSAAD